MEIIKQGKSNHSSVYFECENCGCEFMCEDNEYDTELSSTNEYYAKAKCPCCGKSVYRQLQNCEVDEEVFTKEHPPVYPQDFFHFGNTATVKIDDKDINDWIKEQVRYFTTDPNEQVAITASGDSLVFALNWEDGIHIYVAKNYAVADIEPE